MEAQTQQALSNMKAILSSAQASMSHVVKTTVLLKDLNDFDKVLLFFFSWLFSNSELRCFKLSLGNTSSFVCTMRRCQECLRQLDEGCWMVFEVNGVYGKFFPSEPPARACFQVARLPKDALVEIEVVAHLP